MEIVGGRPSSLVRSVRLAETAATEDEHGEEADNPKREGHVEVVRHRPNHVLSIRFDHRTRTNRIVLGEEESADDD